MATLVVDAASLVATTASCDEFLSSQVGIISNERYEESMRAMTMSVQLQISHVDLDVDGATLVNNAIAGSMFSDVHKRALATAVSDRMIGAGPAHGNALLRRTQHLLNPLAYQNLLCNHVYPAVPRTRSMHQRGAHT